MNTNNPENFWIPHLKESGIHLLVEIQLSFDQFRKLLSDSIGSTQSDQQVFQFWEITNRRLLPTDQNSFSGIGYDIGQILKSALSETPTRGDFNEQ